MKKLVIALAALAVPMVLLGVRAEEQAKHGGPVKAVAVVHGFGSSHIRGVIHFTATAGGVVVRGEISGLTPGKHGFHIHEFGDSSSGEAKCAGGHFNPDKKKHGGPDSAERHVGDLGNITADASGKATIQMTDKLLALSGPHSIIGRAVIIHAKADDLKSQPSGDAGARVAAGTVGIANPEHK